MVKKEKTWHRHPRKTIADRYPNQTTQSRLDNAVCYKNGVMKIRKKEVEVAFFRHADFENVQIYGILRWARVIEEEAVVDFFGKDDGDNDKVVKVNVNNVEPIVEFPNEVARA